MTHVKNACSTFESDEGIVAASKCISIQETRVAIDAVDEKLVALLALRQTYIEREAILRGEKKMHVREAARIEDVILKVLSMSRKRGLSQRIARSVWLVLIEVSIAHQLAMFNKTPFEPIEVGSTYKTQ